MHVAPLNTSLVEFGFQDLLLWAKAADKLLDKYRLALEEIAELGGRTLVDVGDAIEIAEDALKE